MHKKDTKTTTNVNMESNLPQEYHYPTCLHSHADDTSLFPELRILKM